MTHDVEPILKDAEAELTELLKDQEQLSTLRDKYTAEYDAAERAWKQDRKPTQLDKMQQAKAYRDTVTQSLQEQAHEVAKARSHVAQLREQLRRQHVLAELTEDAARLSALQTEHTEGLRTLFADVHARLCTLGALRAEWRQKHMLSWEKVLMLSPDRAEAFALIEQAGLDIQVFQLAAPALGASLAAYQRPYMVPLPEDAKVRATAEAMLVSLGIFGGRFSGGEQ